MRWKSNTAITQLQNNEHLLGQTEDLLPSGETLLMAFPEKCRKWIILWLGVFSVQQNSKFYDVCSDAPNSIWPVRNACETIIKPG